MSCFPCFSSYRTKRSNSNIEYGSPSKEPSPSASPENKKQKPGADPKNNEDEINQVENGNSNAFTFRDLAAATNNFRQACLLGEGGFGRVYKGTLKANGQVVAVKQFDRNGMQGNKEFLVEVQMLSLLHHPNLVNLIGHCADGDQRLLVYEYISGGSLEDHLLDIRSEKKTLDWFTRMKIALGAANGLEYLHDKANPPVIYRDLKSSNILLDEGLCPKLSDFGLAKLGPAGDKMHISPRVMGTYGYCAPEYSRTGQLTLKSDIYSFGVVMLELITGRRAIDTTRPNDEQNLVTWAQPFFRDPKRFPDMADPLLNNQFPERSLNQAVAVAAMCLQEEAEVRPLIGDVVATLSFLSMEPEEGLPAPVPAPNLSSKEKCMNEGSSDDEDRDSEKLVDEDTSDHQNGDNAKHQDGDSSDSEDGDISDYEDDESVDHQDKDSDGSVSSSHKSSTRSCDASVASSCKSREGSQKKIASLSHKSSRKSSSRKSSQKSGDQSVSLSCKASTRSSDGSVSSGHNSNKGSRNRSVSSSRSSRGSKDGSVSVGRNSSVGSKEGSDSFGWKSSGISQDGSICFDHSNSRESDNGSIHLP